MLKSSIAPQLAAAFLAVTLACGDAVAACRWVKGHYRKDGTYVKPYERCDGRPVSGAASVPEGTLMEPSSPALDKVLNDATRLTPPLAVAPPLSSTQPVAASASLISTAESGEERKILALAALVAAVAALFWLIWHVTARAAKTAVDFVFLPFLLVGQWRRRADAKAAKVAVKAAALAAAQEEKRRRAEAAVAKRAAMVGALGGLLQRKKPLPPPADDAGK